MCMALLLMCTVCQDLGFVFISLFSSRQLLSAEIILNRVIEEDSDLNPSEDESPLSPGESENSYEEPDKETDEDDGRHPIWAKTSM